MKEITRIPLEGLHNTRDLGGFETADGRKIRPRRLIRSGQLSGMTEKDKQVLTEDYGLRTDVDFRTGQERTEAPDPRLPGVAYVENPILSDQAIGITREKDSEEDMMKLLVQQMSTSEKAAEEYMAGLYRNYGSFFQTAVPEVLRDSSRSEGRRCPLALQRRQGPGRRRDSIAPFRAGSTP